MSLCNQSFCFIVVLNLGHIVELCFVVESPFLLISIKKNYSIVSQYYKTKLKSPRVVNTFYRHCNFCHVLRWLLSNRPSVREKSTVGCL